jgi:prephenate dehydrogenase
LTRGRHSVVILSYRTGTEGTAIFEDKTLAIIGVGLLGGSLGMAVREKKLFAEVRGTTRRQQTLDEALALGAIDKGFMDPLEAAAGADVVVVATAVSTIPDLCVQCAGVAREGALITDVGSVKAKTDASVRPRMPQGRFYIGSHPMAGGEKTGVSNARADLLSGATCIVTPSADTDDRHYRMLTELWQSVGMKVFKMNPEEHDWVVANISHLPHVIAAALVASIPDGALPFGASGLRDTTRVAAGDASLWRDIVEANQQQVVSAIERFEEHVEKMKAVILRGDYTALEDYLRDAAEKRRKRFDGGTT